MEEASKRGYKGGRGKNNENSYKYNLILSLPVFGATNEELFQEDLVDGEGTKVDGRVRVSAVITKALLDET